jgi:hypothetical protein
MIAPRIALRSIIAFYDIKRKTILKYGSSRPCGHGHNLRSIHAEQLAIHEYNSLDKKRNIRIYIWRYTDKGDTKSTMCCHRCTKLMSKYDMCKKIFTFEGESIISAISESPSISLAYKIKRNLW